MTDTRTHDPRCPVPLSERVPPDACRWCDILALTRADQNERIADAIAVMPRMDRLSTYAYNKGYHDARLDAARLARNGGVK